MLRYVSLILLFFDRDVDCAGVVWQDVHIHYLIFIVSVSDSFYAGNAFLIVCTYFIRLCDMSADKLL